MTYDNFWLHSTAIYIYVHTVSIDQCRLSHTLLNGYIVSIHSKLNDWVVHQFRLQLFFYSRVCTNHLNIRLSIHYTCVSLFLRASFLNQSFCVTRYVQVCSFCLGRSSYSHIRACYFNCCNVLRNTFVLSGLSFTFVLHIYKYTICAR